MLQINPQGPRELPPTAEMLQKAIQEATDSRFEKSMRTRRQLITFGKIAVLSSLFINAHTALYLSDVRSNMAATDEAKPAIVALGAAPEDSTDKANIYFDGFNTFDADSLIKSIGPGYQESFGGENWSIQYNNAPLDSKELTHLTTSRIEDYDIASVDFTSYSMGNDPMLDVAAATIATTDTRVENITILSGPADFDTLTPTTKDELALAKNLSWIPWIEHSTALRYVLETYFYRENIEKNAWAAFDGIHTRFSNGDVTTNSFLASQIESVSELNAAEKIKEIASYSDTKHMPNINVITIKGGKDTVVDNERSAEKICTAAKESGLNCTIKEVKSVHSGYYFPKSVEQYNAVFEKLAPKLETFTAEEIARASTLKYGRLQLLQHQLGAPEKQQ